MSLRIPPRVHPAATATAAAAPAPAARPTPSAPAHLPAPPLAAPAFRPAGTSSPVTLADALRQARMVTRGAGYEAILSPHDLARLQRLGASLPLQRRAQLEDLLGTAGGAEPALTRALILKAVVARSSSVARSDAAWSVIGAFAARAAGLSPDELRRRTTSLDLDHRSNSSGMDPVYLDENRGTIRDPTAKDRHADNDGLLQRFTAACGATTLQMMLAESDPVLALSLHDEGIESDGTADATARMQRTILETYGGAAVGRREKNLWSRLNNALGRMPGVDPSDRAHLVEQLARGPVLDARATAVVEQVRARHGGFPDAADIQRMAGQPPRPDAGLDFDQFQRALDDLATESTGVRYRQTTPAFGFARGQAWRHLDAVESALRRGVDVPFGLVEPAHWMLLSDVRGRAPERRFLVSDPAGGRTAWVTEKDLVRGTFAATQFHLNRPAERPYVDSFYLPTGA